MILRYFQAILQQDGEMLDRTAGGIRGRSLRICDVVDGEMDQHPSNQYTETVRNATRRLRDNVLPQFVARAGKIVEGICDAEQTGEERDTDQDVNEMIDACQLVHDAVNDIRHALLMNRNPEDVDSDNEYEEG